MKVIKLMVTAENLEKNQKIIKKVETAHSPASRGS